MARPEQRPRGRRMQNLALRFRILVRQCNDSQSEAKVRIKRPKTVDTPLVDLMPASRQAFFRSLYFILFSIVTYNIPSHISAISVFGITINKDSIGVIVVYLILFSALNYILAIFVIIVDNLYFPPKGDKSIQRHCLYLAWRRMSWVQARKRYGYPDWRRWLRIYYRVYLFTFGSLILSFFLSPLFAYVFFARAVWEFFSS
jgi:hypothetical protein